MYWNIHKPFPFKYNITCIIHLHVMSALNSTSMIARPTQNIKNTDERVDFTRKFEYKFLIGSNLINAFTPLLNINKRYLLSNYKQRLLFLLFWNFFCSNLYYYYLKIDISGLCRYFELVLTILLYYLTRFLKLLWCVSQFIAVFSCSFLKYMYPEKCYDRMIKRKENVSAFSICIGGINKRIQNVDSEHSLIISIKTLYDQQIREIRLNDYVKRRGKRCIMLQKSKRTSLCVLFLE